MTAAEILAAGTLAFALWGVISATLVLGDRLPINHLTHERLDATDDHLLAIEAKVDRALHLLEASTPPHVEPSDPLRPNPQRLGAPTRND